MKVILILGSYGSGTTALTGALAAMDVPSIPPYFETNDPKTPNSYESVKFRELIHLVANEATLKVDRSNLPLFKDGLIQMINEVDDGSDKTITLKMPLASLCLPPLIEILKPAIVMVHRPFTEIEASRVRRKWHAVFGGAGAQVIYSQIFSDLMIQKKSYMAVAYQELLENTRTELLKVIDYCQLTKTEAQIQKAVKFIRN